MTIAAPAPEVRDDYLSVGAGPFVGHWQIDDAGEVAVWVAGALKILGTDYSVSGVGGSFFSVTLSVAPPTNTPVTLLRSQTLAQQSGYSPGEKFPARRVEKDFDKAIKICQMFGEKFRRVVSFAVTSLKQDIFMDDPVDTKFAYYDGATNKIKWATVAPAGTLPDPVTIARGGTGATTAAAARTALAVPGLTTVNAFTQRQDFGRGVDVASATALTPGSDGNYFHVTGVTTITSIAGAPAGSMLFLRFTGALTLTHGATLILPTSANILTAANDTAVFISDAPGTWRCIGYMRASGQSLAASTTPLGALVGLVVSNSAGDPTNDIDISAGAVTDDNATLTSRVTMILPAGITKQLDALWAVGTNQGMRDTGAIADGTWHLFVIMRSDTGVVDAIASASPTAPLMPTSYDKKWRFLSITREGGVITPISHDGDVVLRKASKLDVDAPNPGIAAVLYPLSVPTGIKVIALFNIIYAQAGTSHGIYVSSPDQNDEQTSVSAAPLESVSGSGVSSAGAGGFLRVRTDTLGRIRIRQNASAAGDFVRVALLGYEDYKRRSG